LSKKVTALDKDAKNPDESPNQLVQNALKAIGGASLPRVVALSLGSVVKHVEMPKTEDEMLALLKEWGLLK
jgi:hypothetical protein